MGRLFITLLLCAKGALKEPLLYAATTWVRAVCCCWHWQSGVAGPIA